MIYDEYSNRIVTKRKRDDETDCPEKQNKQVINFTVPEINLLFLQRVVVLLTL